MIGDILQPSHLLFILVIALIVLGPKRLPEAGRALGRGLRDLRNALNTDELRDQMISTTTEMSMPTSPETEAAQTPVPSPPTEGPTATGDQATQANSYPAFAGEEPVAPTSSAPEQTVPTPPRETAASAPAPDRTP